MVVKLCPFQDTGTMPRRPRAAVSATTLKVNDEPFHTIEVNVDALRASNHCNICRADTTGTPRAWAEVTTAVATSEVTKSVCALTV